MGSPNEMNSDSLSNTLFIVDPSKQTHTLRNLPNNLKVSKIESNLELLSGLASGTYYLCYGEKQLSSEEYLNFSTNVHSGSLLRVHLHRHCEDLFSAVVAGTGAKVVRECLKSSGDLNGGLSADRCFAASFLAAKLGKVAILQTMVKLGVPVLNMCTEFGRTLAHVAAAADQANIISYIITRRSDVNKIDKSGQSPTDVARDNGAYIACRVLRNFNLRLNTSTHNNQKSSSTKRSKISKTSVLNNTQSPGVVITMDAADSFSSVGGEERKTKQRISFMKTDNTPSIHRSEGNISRDGATAVASVQNQNGRNKSRVKSAPSEKEMRLREKHKPCGEAKPFIMRRHVPFEELKPVAVEHVPMDRVTIIGMDQKSRDKNVLSQLAASENRLPSAPYSSLNNSRENLYQAGVITPRGSRENLQQAGMLNPSRENTRLNGILTPRSTNTIEVKNIETSASETSYRSSHFDRQKSEKSVSWVDENFTLNTMAEPEKRAPSKQDIFEEYTRPRGQIPTRAQSAKYYRSQFHIKAEEEDYYKTIPRPRPATAGTRYRAWKEWLSDKYQDEELNPNDEGQDKRKEKNMKAYKRWLARKQKEDLQRELDNESSESEEDIGYYLPKDELTYDKWIRSKEDTFKEMDKNRRDVLAGRPVAQKNKTTVYKIGDTNPEPVSQGNPNHNMRAYQKWMDRKQKYTAWKKMKGLPVEEFKECKQNDLRTLKRQYYFNGFTYEEWLGFKQRESVSAKLHVATVKNQ